MTPARRILLAVNDAVLRDAITEYLTAAGHAVVPWPGSGSADLAVVDDRHPEAPALCAAAKARTRVVLAIGASLAGADTIVERPLRLGTLGAKVAELTRNRTAVRVGPWRFDVEARLLAGDDGTRVRLTDKETAILAFLAHHDGTVTRERLLAEVWGYSAAITTHTLETHIYRLRRKLERDPTQARFLVTEDGGYRLVTGP